MIKSLGNRDDRADQSKFRGETIFHICSQDVHNIAICSKLISIRCNEK